MRFAAIDTCCAVLSSAVLCRPGIPIDNMCTSFSAMGSAVILPLDPAKGYQFEVAIFGGGTQVWGCHPECGRVQAEILWLQGMQRLYALQHRCTDMPTQLFVATWLLYVSEVPSGQGLHALMLVFLQGKGLDCKGVCNAPAAKTIFRMKMPTVTDALAGKWPGDWVHTNGQSYEEMPYGRVFADAVLLPNGQVGVQLVWVQHAGVV